MQADTLRRINEGLLTVAVKMGLEEVSKLRLDTTVVETDIRYPRDSGMLWDTVRVLSRLVDRLRALVPAAARGFPVAAGGPSAACRRSPACASARNARARWRASIATSSRSPPR